MTDEQIRTHVTRFDRSLSDLKALFELGLAFSDGGTDDAQRARIKVLEAHNKYLTQMLERISTVKRREAVVPQELTDGT